mgnify:CR=1 FL=1
MTCSAYVEMVDLNHTFTAWAAALLPDMLFVENEVFQPVLFKRLTKSANRFLYDVDVYE